ncbi:hypothetical protein ACFCVO_19475 [Agromyces sp. NPDC056379]|uniref:hypothetical protein n=1 Tax=unclassified Agromyces TaxID=2639701 RepID=UPI0035E07DB5
MTDKHTLLDELHEATHRIPGAPAHAMRHAGHQGDTRHGRTAQVATAGRRAHGSGGNHPARPPRVLVAWQRRIAEFFGRERA